MNRFLARLLNVFQPHRDDAALARELAAHLTLIEDDLRRRGLAPDAARAAARRTLGSTAYAQDLYREARSFAWVDDLRRDVQYAFRTLRREPGFTAVVVATLALGIGANTAIFSVVHSVLIRPLPYRDSGRLVRVWENVPGSEIGNGQGPDRRYAAMDATDAANLATRARTIANLSAFGLVRLTTVIDGDATRMDGFTVSAGFFPMLGVAPLLGRTFGAEESTPGREHVVVLGYDAWQRFGGDDRVLGRTVTFSGDRASPFAGSQVAVDVPYTVIGVMPGGFHFPYDNAQFWVPRVPAVPPDGRPSRRETVVRLATGVTPAAAAAEMEAIRAEVRGSPANERPGGSRAGTGRAAPRPRYELVPVHDELTGSVRPALLVLTAAVGLVLLVACVNVANLLLARTASRQREMAVRAAIGAGAGRIVRQLLTESLLLAGLGGAAGAAVALAGVRLFRALATTLARADLGLTAVFPRLAEVAVDGAALAYAILVTLLTGVAFGLAPAIRHARPGPPHILPLIAAAPRSRLRNTLVVVEIAFATVLLIGAGLLINSFIRLATINPGFEPSHLLTFQIGQSTSPQPADQLAFAETFVERLRGMPDVRSAAYARQLPFVQLQDTLRLAVRRNGAEVLLDEGGDVRFVSREYLPTMGIRVVSGRGFTEGDGAGRPGAMVINEALASRAFAGTNPIGQTILYGPQSRRVPFEIVGVVSNVRQFGLDRAPDPQYFMDYRQVPTDPAFRSPPLFPVGVYYAVRTGAETGAVIGHVRTIARELDPHATVTDVATMEQIVANSITRPRMYSVLVGLFAGVAFVLAVIGLYGVMAYAVAQRTQEIGVRMALGAERRDVMRLVLTRSLVLTATGIALGIGGAAGVTRYLESLLFGLRPLDPATFSLVACAFAAVALLASYIPARRAASVDPLVALRAE